MSVYAGPVQDLIDELGRLPGIGPKSAQRIAFHMLKLPTSDALRLANAIAIVKERVSFCQICFNIAEGSECGICADTRRDTNITVTAGYSRILQPNMTASIDVRHMRHASNRGGNYRENGVSATLTMQF